jgi:hypothetical protein
VNHFMFGATFDPRLLRPHVHPLIGPAPPVRAHVHSVGRHQLGLRRHVAGVVRLGVLVDDSVDRREVGLALGVACAGDARDEEEAGADGEEADGVDGLHTESPSRALPWEEQWVGAASLWLEQRLGVRVASRVVRAAGRQGENERRHAGPAVGAPLAVRNARSRERPQYTVQPAVQGRCWSKREFVLRGGQLVSRADVEWATSVDTVIGE